MSMISAWLRLVGIVLAVSPLLAGGSFAASPWVSEKMVNEPVFDGQLLVREAGQQNRKMLLFVHGLGDEAGTTWEHVVPQLAKEYHVVVPDLPGFGQSSKLNQLYSPRKYALLLNWLVSTLPDKPMSLVGHSLGGAISIIYAAQYGQGLERLVLVDSVGVLHRLAVSQYFVKQQLQLEVPVVSDMLNGSLGRITDLVLEKSSRLPLNLDLVLDNALMRNKFLAGNPTRIAALAMVQTDYSLLLDQIKTPTWLLWGELDEIANVRIAEVLQWRLPQAELRILPGLGHSPMLEDAAGFNRALGQALISTPRVFTAPPATTTAADGSCNQQSGVLFQGRYKTLRITGCKNVRLNNVRAEQLLISGSQVKIEKTQIGTGGAGPALKVWRSMVTATAVDVHSETAIVSDESRFDLAGLRFMGARTVIRAEGNPSAFLSSSSVKEYSGTKTAIHLSRTLNPGDEL